MTDNVDQTNVDESSSLPPVSEAIRPLSDRNAPNPILIRESRYNGTYAPGRWVLVAGARDPVADTGAWGTDTECNKFWTDRRDDPEFTITHGTHERTCYATAGDDPNELIREILGYYGDIDG